MKGLVVIAVLLPLVLAQQLPQVVLETAFQSMDGNHDGHVTFGEFQNLFDSFDDNGDGHLTLAEYRKHTHLPLDVLGPLFQQFDLDHSNTLDWDKEGQHAFHLYDTSGDNSISKAEFTAEYTHLFQIVASQLSGVNPVGK